MMQLLFPAHLVLPVEVVIDGVRLCRHHGLPITAPGYPCGRCRSEGAEHADVTPEAQLAALAPASPDGGVP